MKKLLAHSRLINRRAVQSHNLLQMQGIETMRALLATPGHRVVIVQADVVVTASEIPNRFQKAGVIAELLYYEMPLAASEHPTSEEPKLNHVVADLFLKRNETALDEWVPSSLTVLDWTEKGEKPTQRMRVYGNYPELVAVTTEFNMAMRSHRDGVKIMQAVLPKHES